MFPPQCSNCPFAKTRLPTVATSKKVALSCHALCSHAVKNTLWSKEDTDNVPTDRLLVV